MSIKNKILITSLTMFIRKIISKSNLTRYYSIALHNIHRHKVVPDIIDIIPPELAEVIYPDDVRVEIGVELKPVQVKDVPKIKWAAKPDKFYTVCLTDPDAPSSRNPVLREWHHWLVGNISGNNVEGGEVLTEYMGAGPPRGSGLHRYVFLVYEQGSRLTFDEARIKDDSVTNRALFSARKFAVKYNLTKAVAANFFHAQWDDYVPVLYERLKLESDSPLLVYK